jgi:hypothetical protein
MRKTKVCVSLVKFVIEKRQQVYGRAHTFGCTHRVAEVVATKSLGGTNLCMSVLVR